MDKLAVWAGSGCMAVFRISGLRSISSPCTVGTENCFFVSFPSTAELVHQWNSQKTVSKPHSAIHFAFWYLHAEGEGEVMKKQVNVYK